MSIDPLPSYEPGLRDWFLFFAFAFEPEVGAVIYVYNNLMDQDVFTHSILINFVMADRLEKRRRLDRLRRRLPHLTASAFEAIAKEFGADDMSRHELKKARDEVLEEDTNYGPILKRRFLKTTTGALMSFLIACPLASLSMACSVDGSFTRHLLTCLREKPPTYENPWNIVIPQKPSNNTSRIL